MADTTDQRIRCLEQEIAELKAKSAPPRPTAPVEEEGVVRVEYLNTYSIAMPTTTEYENLLAIVERAGYVPRSADRSEFFAGFVRSFERITSLRRLEGLNMNRPAHEWAMEAHGWLNERGTSAETTNGSFFAAAVAAGDVPYSLHVQALGIPARLGLTYDPEARRAFPSWQTVLERGAPRAPEPGPRALPQNQCTAEVRYG